MFIDVIPLNGSSQEMVVNMMNGEYSKAILCYVQYYAGKPNATDATLLSIDSTTIRVSYKEPFGNQADEFPSTYGGEARKLDWGDSSWTKMRRIICCEKCPSWLHVARSSMRSLDTNPNNETELMSRRLLTTREDETTIRLISEVHTVGDARRVLVQMARISSQHLGVHLSLPPEMPANSGTESRPTQEMMDTASDAFSRPPSRELIEALAQLPGAGALPPELQSILDSSVADPGGASSQSSSSEKRNSRTSGRIHRLATPKEKAGDKGRGMRDQVVPKELPAENAKALNSFVPFRGNGDTCADADAGGGSNQEIPNPTRTKQTYTLKPKQETCEIKIQSAGARGGAIQSIFLNKDATIYDVRCVLDAEEPDWRPYELLGGLPRRPLSNDQTIESLNLISGTDCLVKKEISWVWDASEAKTLTEKTRDISRGKNGKEHRK